MGWQPFYTSISISNIREYKSEEDILQQFQDEETERHPDYRDKCDDFIKALNLYQKNSGKTATYSKTKVSRELTNRGLDRGSTERKSYVGIRLLGSTETLETPKVSTKIENILDGQEGQKMNTTQRNNLIIKVVEKIFDISLIISMVLIWLAILRSGLVQIGVIK